MVGLGLGPLIAGTFAQYLPAPTRLVFWAYLGLTGLALLALRVVPETVARPDRAFRLRLQIAIPASMRLVMLGAMLGIFAAFTLLGLFSSLVPSFLRGILGVHNLAVIGAASFLIFATAALSQALFARLASRQSVSLGLPLLLVGLGALEGSLFAPALWLFLVGTGISGIGVGLVFRGALSEIVRLAEAAHRAQAMSAFFAAAYLGLGLPVVLIGLLSQVTGTVDASAYVAGLLGVVIVARPSRPAPSDTPAWPARRSRTATQLPSHPGRERPTSSSPRSPSEKPHRNLRRKPPLQHETTIRHARRNHHPTLPCL